jgi:hypothetical protein
MSYVRNVLATSVILAVACGGSSSTDNLSADAGGTVGDGSPSGVVDGASSSSSGSSGGASSGGADDSGLTEVDDSGYIAIPGGDDGGEDDGGSGASSSGSGGGGMDATVGVTSPPHGTDGGAHQIECGATPCDSLTQVCCATALGRMCTAAGACNGDTLSCSGTNSCATAGDVCCEDLSEGGRTLRTTCRAACGLSPQLCTTDADCTKAGQYCRKYGNYGVCERPAAAAHDQ